MNLLVFIELKNVSQNNNNIDFVGRKYATSLFHSIIYSPNQVLTQSQSNAGLFVFFFCLLESSQVCKILSFVIAILKASNQHIFKTNSQSLTLLQETTLKVG